jgi:hypothetical protein
MTAVTGWEGGRLNSGLGWTALFNSADLASLAHGDSVLSSVADITNGTSLDQFIDISMSLAIASATPTAGDYVGFFLAALNQDGSTYADGSFPSGTAKAWAPSWQAAATIVLQSGGGAITSLVGLAQGIVIPPGSFRFVCYLATSSISLSSGTQTVKFRSYNVRLDNAS